MNMSIFTVTDSLTMRNHIEPVRNRAAVQTSLTETRPMPSVICRLPNYAHLSY